MIGQTLAQFKILDKLGEGGMGVVYRAKDTVLDRPVAIKVIRPEAMAHPLRKERFIREAKAASALNHPNIITIYEIGTANELDFIAMEFVAGKTVERLIGRRGLPLAEALRCAIQVADALATAHAAGIVHRDLKPANIMVTEKKLVKVLDFGLAKLIDPVEVEDATLGDETAATRSLRMDEALRTEVGVIVGTAAYMSPEQAEGRKVDARSDIFAFGSVLYEMLSGQRAFQGDTRMAILSAIILKEPTPLSQVAEGIPAEVERIVWRCLHKEPDRRLQHMDDLKLALEELRDDSFSGRLSAVTVAPPPQPTEKPVRRRFWAGLAVAAMLLLAAGGGLGWWWSRRGVMPAGSPSLTRLTSDSGLSTDPALSPDGRLLAYASDRGGEGNLDIWVQHVATGGPTRLTRDAADEYEPAFSPDGSRIVFRSDREGGGIEVVSPLGGASRRIAAEGRQPQFSPDGSRIAYWTGNPGGSFLFTGNSRIYVVPGTGGVTRQIRPEFASASYPIWSSDGKHLLFLGSRDRNLSASDGLDWWVTATEGGSAPTDTGSRQVFRDSKIGGPVIPRQWLARADWVVFSGRSGDSTNLWGIPVSSRNRKIAGAPERLTTGTTLERQPSMAVDPGGALRVAFASLAENIDIWSLPVDANQAKVAGSLQRVTEDAAADIYPIVSSSGKKVVFTSNRSGNPDIWLKDLASGRETALTESPANESLAILSPDDAQVAYRVLIEDVRQELWVVASGGGLARRVCEDCGYPMSWTSDRAGLLYLGRSPARVSLLDLGSGSKTGILQYEPVRLWESRLSPDNRWMSFTATTTARSRVQVAPFRPTPPAVTEKEWIAVTDAKSWSDKPYWSPDGNLIYYVSDQDGLRCIWAQRLHAGSKQPVGEPVAIHHSHGVRRSLMNLGLGPLEISVARDKLVFNMGERTGNIWMAEWKPQ